MITLWYLRAEMAALARGERRQSRSVGEHVHQSDRPHPGARRLADRVRTGPKAAGPLWSALPKEPDVATSRAWPAYLRLQKTSTAPATALATPSGALPCRAAAPP